MGPTAQLVDPPAVSQPMGQLSGGETGASSPPTPPPASQQECGQPGNEGTTTDLDGNPRSLHGTLVISSRIRVTSFLNSQLCIYVYSNKNMSFSVPCSQPFLTLRGPHSHTPADIRPLRGEAAAGPALRSPWSARIYPVWDPEQMSQRSQEGREGRSLSPKPAAHRRRLQFHKALFRPPLGSHQTAPGEEWGGGPSECPREVDGVRPPRLPRPRPGPPPSQALHALLRQQLPELLAAQAQPLGLGRRAVGEEVLGPMRALRQLLGPRAGGQELPGTGEGRDAGSARGTRGREARSGIPIPFPHAPSACPAPPRAGPHQSTRPAGTSTAAGSSSGSIGPPSAAARAPPPIRPPPELRAALAPAKSPSAPPATGWTPPSWLS